MAVVVGLLQLLGSKSRLTISELVASAIVAIITATVVLVVGLVTSLLFVLITSNAANGVLGEHLYSFQVDGLREQTSANDSLVKWGGARAAHRIGGFILISVAPALFHVLPRRCFASVDDYDAFWHMTQRLKG